MAGVQVFLIKWVPLLRMARSLCTHRSPIYPRTRQRQNPGYPELRTRTWRSPQGSLVPARRIRRRKRTRCSMAIWCLTLLPQKRVRCPKVKMSTCRSSMVSEGHHLSLSQHASLIQFIFMYLFFCIHCFVARSFW
ncbi:hypothetical protein PGIGA_G00049940 [Pangasianodon gigas]|uniref:Uncharacterized protein n=1 Tax=Pangasianodon gigas TaxID=30993 RepID=A0ACC5X222_PANGG|nr:hypothetical protein [Pangasianodon gigas]